MNCLRCSSEVLFVVKKISEPVSFNQINTAMAKEDFSNIIRYYDIVLCITCDCKNPVLPATIKEMLHNNFDNIVYK